MTPPTDNTVPEDEELIGEDTPETPKIPPVAQKVSRFGNQGGMSKFGK
jgi:hypothetical protein